MTFFLDITLLSIYNLIISLERRLSFGGKT
nr:MAG TPA: hypothetical protein [Caudoviricetes sp.]